MFICDCITSTFYSVLWQCHYFFAYQELCRGGTARVKWYTSWGTKCSPFMGQKSKQTGNDFEDCCKFYLCTFPSAFLLILINEVGFLGLYNCCKSFLTDSSGPTGSKPVEWIHPGLWIHPRLWKLRLCSCCWTGPQYVWQLSGICKLPTTSAATANRI